MELAASLVEQHAPSRLFAHDHTLWSPAPTEIADRLGWTDEPARIGAGVDAVHDFVARCHADGIDHVVWCGMGGSSLFPELLATSALRGDGAPSMRVLDTSHPAAIQRATAEARDHDSLYVFASKSGGTVETRSQLDHFWSMVGDARRFAVVTDAGSALDSLATERGFRASFHANPEIGGRYSALSHFGIVAAALLGVDVAALLDGAQRMAEACAPDTTDNPGVELAALLGAARDGRDKVVLDCDPAFAAWLEQLLAESTGKHGTGVVPVPGDAGDANGPDRARVSYGRGGDLDLGGSPTADARRLGGEIMRWEVATALAGVLLAINPFDQPDVEAAKVAAREALGRGAQPPEPRPLGEALAAAGPGRYVAIQAFVDPEGPVARRLHELRVALRDRTGAAATAAIGPRYLHSTGQLHKGGPPSGVFVQVLDDVLDGVLDGGGSPGAQTDVAIPGTGHTFGALLVAQAAGDLAALHDRGRPAMRVRATELLAQLDG